MAFPSGVTTCILSVGPFINAEGTVLSVALTVTPVFGSSVDFITWNATGVAMSNATITGTVQSDGSSQVEVPVVDQTGWIDPTTAGFTMWRYTVNYTVNGKTGVKNVQPLDGQTSIDVDKIASGAVGTPVSTPLAVVTDVGGFTGSVSVTDLESLGLGGGVSDWASITGKPAFIGAGADAAAARAAIGAGTSSLGIGTTGSTAAAGNDSRLSDTRTPTAHTHATTDITSGTLAYARLSLKFPAEERQASDGSWPSTDVEATRHVEWIGYPGLTDPPASTGRPASVPLVDSYTLRV